MNTRFFSIIIIILIAGNLFLGFKYLSARQELAKIATVTNQSDVNDKILDFTSMFIKDVLKTDKEVDFETRLVLETNVRNLNDPEIMAQWQNFTNSKTEVEAQDNVKKLLETLVAKIRK